MRLIIGIIVSAVAFILTVSIFGAADWPNSLLALGVMLGVAWLVGAAVGERIAASRWPAIVATALAVGLAVSTIGFGVPWRLDEPIVGIEEDVWFRMKTSFTYRGSEDNLPIENVAIRLPCPNVDNVAPPTYATWFLYYQDDDNVLHLQADSSLGAHVFVGERTAMPEILLSIIEPTMDGPKLTHVVDKLYPREVFWIVAFAHVSGKDADKVTLRDYGDNEGRSSGGFARVADPSLWGTGGQLGPFDDPIDVAFWAQLSVKVGDNYRLVETFSRSADNLTYAMLWLYP